MSGGTVMPTESSSINAPLAGSVTAAAGPRANEGQPMGGLSNEGADTDAAIAGAVAGTSAAGGHSEADTAGHAGEPNASERVAGAHAALGGTDEPAAGDDEFAQVSGGLATPSAAGVSMALDGSGLPLGGAPDEMAPAWPDDARLDVERAGTFRARLAWTEATDDREVARYLVYQDAVLVGRLNGEEHSLTVGPLRATQTYTFQVQAEDEAGNLSEDGPSTSIILADEGAPRFLPSARLDFEQVHADTARLTWTHATDTVGVAQYRIYQDHLAIADIGAQFETYDVVGLLENQDYIFRIEALDAAGNESVNGPTSSIFMRDQTGPMWMPDARVWATSIAETTLRLNWSAATDNAGIRMYRIFQSGSEIALIEDPQLWVELEGLTPNTEYQFQIVAEDRAGQQSAIPLQATVRTVDQTPPTWDALASLLVLAVNGTSATLGWSTAQDPGQIAAYILYQDDIEVGNIAADTTQFTIDNLSILTDYTFRVEAVDASGNATVNGPRLTTRFDDANPPSWPVDAAISLLASTETSAQISWTPASDDVGIAGYDVLVAGQSVATTGPDRRLVDLSGLAAASTVEVTIVALDSAGQRTEGPTLQIAVPDYAAPQWPNAPMLTTANLTTTGIELTWSTVPPAPEHGQFAIFQDDVRIALVDLNTLQYDVTGLMPNTAYTFRVEIVGPTGQVSVGGPSVDTTTLDLNPPSWPVDASIQVDAVTETSATISWSDFTPADEVAEYAIFLDEQLIGTLGPAMRSIVLNTLHVVTQYTIRVEAVGPTGRRSSNGPATAFTTVDLTRPTWPANAQATSGRITRDTAELTWTDATDNVGVSGYRIETDTGLSWTTMTNTVIANQLMPSTPYRFSIFALDGAGLETATPLTLNVQTNAASSLSDRDIYDGLRPDCVACHGAGSTSPYFESFEQFEQRVINDAHLVNFGDPEGSLFIRVMEGNGDAPWASMPLGNRNYRQLSLRGETAFTMDEVKAWIRAMGGQ